MDRLMEVLREIRLAAVESYACSIEQRCLAKEQTALIREMRGDQKHPEVIRLQKQLVAAKDLFEACAAGGAWPVNAGEHFDKAIEKAGDA